MHFCDIGKLPKSIHDTFRHGTTGAPRKVNVDVFEIELTHYLALAGDVGRVDLKKNL